MAEVRDLLILSNADDDLHPEVLDLGAGFESPSNNMPRLTLNQVDPFPYLHDSSPFSVLELDEDMLSPDLSPAFDIQDCDWGSDELFLGRRSSGSESIEFSRARSDGPRIVEFESDAESDAQLIAISDDCDGFGGLDRAADDAALCWDCLRIEEDRREEEFEWEEVEEADGHLDEREVLSLMLGSEEEAVGVLTGLRGGFDEDTARNVEWEVLTAVNNFADDQEGFVYTSEYDVLVGQFAEHDSFKGTPPAAKSVVESLPSVIVSEEDIANKNTSCAVCKDEIAVEERAKKLPCSHHYHEECILQWLGIRNTCPLCRFELPTDDAEYENWKARRAGDETSVEEGRLSLKLWSHQLELLKLLTSVRGGCISRCGRHFKSLGLYVEQKKTGHMNLFGLGKDLSRAEENIQSGTWSCSSRLLWSASR